MVVSKKSKQVVFISSWPKSGSTWVTRLIGDVLNSPTGGSTPEQDIKEVATEGQDRSGQYIVRKGHFVLIDTLKGPVVPKPHRLAYKKLTNEKLIVLVRDPRDVCVSGAWHWQVKPEQFLNRMIAGDVAKCGRWDTYYNSFMRLDYQNIQIVRFEDLLDNTVSVIDNLLQDLELDSALDVQECVTRNSFAVRKAQIGDDEKELRRNNMRKGTSGDWFNHFTAEMNDKIHSEFGWMMERLGYFN